MQQPPPSFDTWTSGFLLVVAVGFFIFILMMGRTKKMYPVAFFVLAFSLILLQYVLYWTHYQFVYPYLVLLPPLCYYVTGPLLYLYFLNLYKKGGPALFPLHFIPAALCFIPYVFTLFRNIGFNITYIPLRDLPQYYQPIIVHMVIYTVLLFRIIYAHRAEKTQYATLRKRWAIMLASLYLLFILAYLSYYILVNFSFFNNEWDYTISITMAASIYTIGYFIFKQPQIFDGELYAPLFLPTAPKGESLENQLLDELYKKITTYMEVEKPYTDNELRLVNLADQLGFSAHLLSKVINQRSGSNFNTFINQYRIIEAEKLLKQNPSAPVKTVYFDVGFNSKAVFYAAFKQRNNCTPLQYRQRFEAPQLSKFGQEL